MFPTFWSVLYWGPEEGARSYNPGWQVEVYLAQLTNEIKKLAK